MLLNKLLKWLLTLLLSLRYRINISGLDEIKAKGRAGILFLPNHPALIDPVLLSLTLHDDFSPISLADEERFNGAGFSRLASRLKVRTIPSMDKGGRHNAVRIQESLEGVISEVEKGENLLLYPAGRLKRKRLEEVWGTSAVELIFKRLPKARIVMVRQNGLWGSRFSWGFNGKKPEFLPVLKLGIKYLIMNGLFFMPRREISYSFVEPFDFPGTADRMKINRYLEDFYNEEVWPNRYVPYSIWESGVVEERSDPQFFRVEGNPDSVPETTRTLVLKYLEELTGRDNIKPDDDLARDLGLDSLTVMNIIMWLEQDFGFSQDDPQSLQTVGDVMLAAIGEGVASGSDDVRLPDSKWFEGDAVSKRVSIPEGSTIAEVFLNRAKQSMNKIIIADQRSGEKSYRDIILSIMILCPHFKKLSGKYVGIMLPASVGAVITYLAVIFSGKIPVMFNWTVGPRNVSHSLKQLNVQHIVTSKVLIDKLKMQGSSFESVYDYFVYLEDYRSKITKIEKLIAFIKSRVNWKSLGKESIADIALVLFTSGSESFPKAVPLTHNNILTNIRDILSALGDISESDSMIAMLPPFHSFGITATTIFVLCANIRTVYHSNPTESGTLARLIEAYRCTLLLGTPTFLNGITRVASEVQLKTLRLAVTGAEKCPQAVYELLQKRCPTLTILEGYGITECSPVVSVNPMESPKAFSIGKVLPSLEYVLVDPDSGKPVPKGENGVLLVRGPSIFNGYLMHDGDSPFVEFEGKEWYVTGDLVREDEEGVLYFSGRLKRFIKLGGEMISLPAIEEVLASHFAGSENEGPLIAVEATSQKTPETVLFSTIEISRGEANRIIQEAGLSALHNIRKVIKVKEIPLLGTGKTDYRSLKEMLT